MTVSYAVCTDTVKSAHDDVQPTSRGLGNRTFTAIIVMGLQRRNPGLAGSKVSFQRYATARQDVPLR